MEARQSSMGGASTFSLQSNILDLEEIAARRECQEDISKAMQRCEERLDRIDVMRRGEGSSNNLSQMMSPARSSNGGSQS